MGFLQTSDDFRVAIENLSVLHFLLWFQVSAETESLILPKVMRVFWELMNKGIAALKGLLADERINLSEEKASPLIIPGFIWKREVSHHSFFP